jgi:hypothetical protein
VNKIKVSKRAMRENYYILRAGYCKAQYLLKGIDPVAYSVGVYGWACDYYDVEGVVISTGYDPLSSKNIKASYEMINDYDDKARLIYGDGGNYQQKIDAIKALRHEFINKVKNND